MLKLKSKEYSKFASMLYSDVVALSNKKNSRGCATSEALKAQQYLWETNGE